jgi:hypothetical protein
VTIRSTLFLEELAVHFPNAIPVKIKIYYDLWAWGRYVSLQGAASQFRGTPACSPPTRGDVFIKTGEGWPRKGMEAAPFCEQSFRPVFKETLCRLRPFGTTFWFLPLLKFYLYDVLTSSILDFSTSLAPIFVSPVKSWLLLFYLQLISNNSFLPY